jgi:hypothetical protein
VEQFRRKKKKFQTDPPTGVLADHIWELEELVGLID